MTHGRHDDRQGRGLPKKELLDLCSMRISDDAQVFARAGDLAAAYGPRCFRYVSFDFPGGASVVGSPEFLEANGLSKDEVVRAAAANSAERAVSFDLARAALFSPPAPSAAGRTAVPFLREYFVNSADSTEPSFAFATEEALAKAYAAVSAPFAFVLPKRAPAYLVAGAVGAAVARCAAAAAGAFGRPVLGGDVFVFDGATLSVADRRG